LSVDYDIFINTTNFDNHPVSVIEAMALGLPVVTTNVGGVPFLVDDEENGLLVPPNQVDEFVKAVERLIETPELAERIAKNARQKVEAYDWETVKFQWFELIDDAIQ
jgi:glycosyltransferase involved in cell wall biosynthesis